MYKRLVLVVLILLLAFTGLVACKRDNKGNTLVLAQVSDVTSLDPHGANDEVSSNLTCQIYSNLVKYTEDRELVGDLAESWDEIDPTSLHFKIREGVKFHNGEDLSLEDIKFSLERAKTQPVVAHIFEDIKEVNILDNNTIEIKTYEPSAPLMANLASPTGGIMSKKATEELGEEIGLKPIGTGPFKFVDWKAGEEIIIERFDDYFGDKAKLDRAEYKVMSEGNSQLMALETGELDIAYNIDPVNINIVEENENLDYITEDSFTVHYLGFNTQKEPFNNKKVRQAIAYGIDMDQILEVVLENRVKKAGAILNDNVIGSGGSYKNYEYNPEKARELLKEAGYEKGLNMSLTISDNNVRKSISELIHGQLSDIGVDLNIDMMEWGGFLEKVGRGDHDAYLLAATVSTGDGDDPFTLLLHSNQIGSAGNRAFYENEEVDRLIEEGRKELNEDKRVKIYEKLQTIVNEDLPIYPMYYNNQSCGISRRVKNFKLNPAGYHYLQNVEIE